MLYVDGGMPHGGEYWTQVQWQGTDGAWHNVDGWKGFTTNGYARWFVAPSHFGRGPFHWIVSDEIGSQELAVSNQFYLPQHPAEFTITKVGTCCHGDLSRSVILGQ